MTRQALGQGETTTMRGGDLRRRNRHRAQNAACRDCSWTITGPATPGQAVQHATGRRHVVDLEYTVGYTYAPTDRIGEAR